jgi:MFS family permease
MTSKPDASPAAATYRRYVLAVLTVVYVFNFIDRQILVILQESIKAEMGLSDAQIGVLSGFVFAMFYVSLGIPIARWADVGNRRNIIAIAISVWSGMTALAGLAQNYTQLLLARIGVGIGEAGCSPPAHSMISDYYPAEQRGTAISIYSAGIGIGIAFGFLFGGWINEFFGWRVAFLLVGAPGLLIGLLLFLTVREPEREAGQLVQSPGQPGFADTLYTLWSLRSFRYYSIGMGLMAFVAYGVGNFLPSFLMRSHGMSSGATGTTMALVAGLGNSVSVFIAGYLADRLGHRDKRWYLWIAGIPGLLAVPFLLACLYVEDVRLSIAWMLAHVLMISASLGPVIAISHSLVPQNMRAMTSAILFLVLNLVGLGAGPVAVGLISDALNASLGQEALRYALAIVSLSGVLAAILFLFSSRFLLADLSRKQAVYRFRRRAANSGGRKRVPD